MLTSQTGITLANKLSPRGGIRCTFLTNEGIVSFIKWCRQFFSESVGLEGFIIMTETDKPAPRRANGSLRMGSEVMFAQSLLIPVAL